MEFCSLKKGKGKLPWLDILRSRERKEDRIMKMNVQRGGGTRCFHIPTNRQTQEKGAMFASRDGVGGLGGIGERKCWNRGIAGLKQGGRKKTGASQPKTSAESSMEVSFENREGPRFARTNCSG